MVRLVDSAQNNDVKDSKRTTTNPRTTTTSSSSRPPPPPRRQRQRRRPRGTTTSTTTTNKHLISNVPPPRDDLAVLVITVFGAFWLIGFILIGMSKFPSEHSFTFPHPHFQKKLSSSINKKKNQKMPVVMGGNSKYPKFPVLHRFDVVDPSLVISPEALDMCHQTLWHTLETTTIVLPDDETFVHTGDIDDLWLRDSAAQIHPLLLPHTVVVEGDSSKSQSLVQMDPKLARVVSGLIKRTARYIRHDPYANAFRIDDSYVFSPAQKLMGRHDLISTWNYELDSACYYMRMVYYFYQSLPNHPLFQKGSLTSQSIQEALEIMVDVWIAEQRHEDDVYPQGPLLDCQNCGKPYRYPGLPRKGKGTPTNPNAGLTWTGFRPSDDEGVFGYLIPANMFAVVVLQYLSEMLDEQRGGVWSNPALQQKVDKLAHDIDRGIQQYGIVHHDIYGKIYAYEVDGLGNYLLMDDANVPSLMSIPYLGYDYDEEIYQNTRRFILSPDNPTYQHSSSSSSSNGGRGSSSSFVFEGYGSPHMASQIPNNIWPMSIAMQGLTSSDPHEKWRLVHMLVEASAGTHWMHESFNANNPHQFTRSWFCWADSLFAELVMSLTDQCPSLGVRGGGGGGQPQRNHQYKIMEWRDTQHRMKGSILDVEAST